MFRVLLAVALFVGATGVAAAQDAPDRVGRLSYTEGNALLHWDAQADWSPAIVNYPVTTGQTYWTEANSAAEIQIGPIEARLDQLSELDVTRLDDATIVLQLDQGVLNLHLWQMPAGGISVVTRLGRVVFMAAGSYDINIGDPRTGRLQVAVLQGAARLEGAGRIVDIRPSEAAIVSGAGITLSPAVISSFDNWALARERRQVAAQQPGYVAPTVTGYQDLNQYGSWSHDPEYGGVWYPASVLADWAPYRDGHWAFVPPWGWTWIDDAPWGFAPFHYGRWIESRGRWGWVPGRLAERPVYAPALVAFIGGNGWGVELGGSAIAAVGWVALAPNEAYHPSYRASATYTRNVNATSVNRATVNNLSSNNGSGNARVGNFRNRAAATVVPATTFTQAAPVQHATVAVPPAQLSQVAVAPSIAHLRPDAGARTGRAVPVVAPANVPPANAPATISRSRVEVAPPVSAPAPVPRAPDPRRDNGQRGPAPQPAPAAVPQSAPAPAPAPTLATPTITPPARPSPVNVPNVRPPEPPVPPRAPPASAPIPQAATPAAPTPQTVAPPPPQQATPQAAVPPRPQPGPSGQFVRPQHPEQDTHIAPNPQEWTRTPGAPPQAERLPRAPEPPRAAERPHPAPPAATPPAAPAPAAAPTPAPVQASPAKPGDDKKPDAH